MFALTHPPPPFDFSILQLLSSCHLEYESTDDAIQNLELQIWMIVTCNETHKLNVLSYINVAMASQL